MFGAADPACSSNSATRPPASWPAVTSARPSARPTRRASLDFYWVGSLDFNFAGNQVGFSKLNPQVENFLQRDQQPRSSTSGRTTPRRTPGSTARASPAAPRRIARPSATDS